MTAPVLSRTMRARIPLLVCAVAGRMDATTRDNATAVKRMRFKFILFTLKFEKGASYWSPAWRKPAAVAVIALQPSSCLHKRRGCMRRLLRMHLLQRLHWPQWGCTVQATARSAVAIDVCDER